MEQPLGGIVGGRCGAGDTKSGHRLPATIDDAYVRALVVALETALTQHQALVVRERVMGIQWQPGDAGPPDSPAVLLRLRHSTARLELLLAELAVVVPPQQGRTATL